MKIIIEQKDVGKELDLDKLANIGSLPGLVSPIAMELMSEKVIESHINKHKELFGETPSGAPVTIKKERKKPGPKKGSRKKKTNTVKFTTEQLKQEISKTHPDLADKIQL